MNTDRCSDWNSCPELTQDWQVSMCSCDNKGSNKAWSGPTHRWTLTWHRVVWRLQLSGGNWILSCSLISRQERSQDISQQIASICASDDAPGTVQALCTFPLTTSVVLLSSFYRRENWDVGNLIVRGCQRRNAMQILAFLKAATTCGARHG